ncbi:hypothetical protein A5906_13710 [Bradyrhizobium sacchari]|nr:hypothetical protein A5906_13710 [Bradyrhizobium sacchari]
MIFPALFLYRHYIELEFKDLIALGQMSKFDGDASSAKLQRPRHDLEKMLKATVCLSKNAQGDDAAGEFELVAREAIRLFVATDPNGDGFKYSLTFTGKAQWGIHSRSNYRHSFCRNPLRRTLLRP